VRTPVRTLGADLRRIDLPAVGAWLLPFALIAYLGLSDGGYGVVERSEAGIAAWWIIAAATAVGALPVAGGTRAGRAMLVLLAAFAAWTALSLGWTESAERTTVELSRTLTYLGVFALALAVQGNGRWRQLMHGAAAAATLVIGVAVLSRFEPTWFPDRVTAEYLRGIELERALAYPLNYSTGLAGFTAIALPLLVATTASARTVIGSALAAAALPLSILVLWLTGSSLALPAGLVGLGAFVALCPERLPKLVTLLPALAGGAILIAAVEQRSELDRGLPSAVAERQGDEALVIAIVVCAGVALVQVAIALASRHAGRPGWVAISRRTTLTASALALFLTLLVALGAGAPGEISDRWERFKGGPGRDSGTPVERGGDVLDPTASGRYKYWQSAWRASESAPLLGIGPGTFEFWYLRDEERGGGFARDAHSFLLEALAELGIVGLLLIGGFALAVLAIGTVRALRAPPELRVVLAAATAGCAAFTVIAAVDWVWELGAPTAAYFVLAAIAVGAGAGSTRRAGGVPLRGVADAPAFLRAYGGRIALVVVGLAAIVLIAIPLAATTALDRSRADAAAGDVDAALGEAQTAARLQPYAAAPRLQEALLYEQAGDLDRAAEAAAAATRKESTNWRTWLVLSRLEARRDNPEASVDAYVRAKSLFPTGASFQ